MVRAEGARLLAVMDIHRRRRAERMMASGKPDDASGGDPAAGSHAEAGATTCDGRTVITESADISFAKGEFSLIDIVGLPKDKRSRTDRKQIEGDTQQSPHDPGDRSPERATV